MTSSWNINEKLHKVPSWNEAYHNFQFGATTIIYQTLWTISLQEETETDKKKVIRIDYDVALLRLDYPIKDPETGLGVLNSPGFDRKTIMPICLPPNSDFKDTNRAGTAVGMGIKGEKSKSKRCFTNGKGPVVFQKCSHVYVYEHKRDERGDEDYYNAALHHSVSAPCEKEHPPPSSFNKLCKTFYDQIAKLKWVVSITKKVKTKWFIADALFCIS